MAESKYIIRKAVRQPTTVLVALAGPSGSGKTVSGLRLAIGLARGHRNGRVVMIDTEHRRGTHHADTYDYDYLEMKPPFSTAALQEIVLHCDSIGYGAIFVDSMSLEWNGEGGCQDVHDEAIKKLTGGDYNKAKALDGIAWAQAKIPHKKMVGRFVRLDSHIVFGLRAEEKIKYVKEGNETKVIPLGFMPICEKGFMYDMLSSFLMDPENPGKWAKVFKLDDRHKPFFPKGQLIDENAGAGLAVWARANDAAPTDRRATLLAAIKRELATAGSPAVQAKVGREVFGVDGWKAIEALPLAVLEAATTPAEGANISRLEGAIISMKEGAA